jgi:hypothetical protein
MIPEIEAFVNNEIHGILYEMILDARKKQKQSAFNLFSISSYNSHYENYHSDIITALINSDMGHEDDSTNLKLLFDYLNSFDEVKNKINKYEITHVTREEGRIDVAIWDIEAKRVIIIENKINNANDMDNQLLRYYNIAKKENYKVDLIIYLSLDGFKKAPTFAEIDCPVLNIGAFNNQENDLTNGWLNKCLQFSKNESVKSFLNEYIKLLKNLNAKAMENSAIAQFYELVNKSNAIKTIEQIVELNNQIPEHRMDKLMNKIQDYSPFRKSDRYCPNYQIFDNYNDGEYTYKLDFLFKADGSAQMEFWIPDLKTKDIQKSNLTIKSKLEEIDVKEIFDLENFAFTKVYKVGENSDEFRSMNLIDEAIFSDISLLLEKLRQYEKRN